jgi:glycosyltransferase involved in cell wall biosynthesis
MNVSSGIQRTLRFAQYLPQLGWEPLVLTAHTRAYSAVSEASLAEVPPDLCVRRAFAMDAAKHLSIRGWYPRLLTTPDRWWSWWLGAVPAGLELIRKFRPQVLWSTYPIATAHAIGATLRRLSGLPWVADFRDPMTEPGYPADPLEHRVYRWIESKTLRHADRAVFTTPGALAAYAKRYPRTSRSQLTLIENGYDEPSFASAEQAAQSAYSQSNTFVLVHSGTVYPSERDPRPFFRAIAALHGDGRIKPGDFRIVLRGTGCDDYVREQIIGNGIQSFIELKPVAPYRDALQEMLSADALLLLQAANCNCQIPAKLYEYLRAKRPVLALTDPAGDTAAALRAAGIDTIAALECEAKIAQLLVRFLALLRERRAPVARPGSVVSASRQSRTVELARLLEDVVQGGRETAIQGQGEWRI